MLCVRPRSPSADAAPCWAPQPPGPGPAKRPRLHEPARPEPLLQPDQEAPAGPHDDTLISVVFLAAGSALQLLLDGVDLLLEPEPTSVLEVTFQGHTIILVPEGLQTSAQLGQPGFSPSSPQEAALQDLPQDHPVVLQPGPLCEYVQDIYQEVSWDEEKDFLEPSMDPAASQAAGLLSSITEVPSPRPPDCGPEPYPPVPCPDAEPCSPRSVWHLDSYLQGPFPCSPLQPLPPSPPPSPQEQRPPCPPRTPCKARRRLFCE
ncbi:proline-rich protein 23A3-like [Meriones unguiculatus]|uniref:proline-rich protein 23A3-like n=1 Tax=Meriones unguiculatus TaxID=10047 RepID=UPI000B4EC867|nr:proline-rich protein 23A3-like [Meriones unguiculatus]